MPCGYNLPVAPDLLAQNFEAVAPDQKWVSGITYIWTGEGWLYLTVILELYPRRVIGWAMAERMTARLVCDALTMALWRRKLPNGVIVHSDHGSPYCSAAYQALIKKHPLVCSMSTKGDCYDNAAMESWNHSFKAEAIHGEKLETRADAQKHVFEYIEVYYNRNGFIPNWAICPLKPLNLNVSLKLSACQMRARSVSHLPTVISLNFHYSKCAMLRL